jgi:hypothetical protein
MQTEAGSESTEGDVAKILARRKRKRRRESAGTNRYLAAYERFQSECREAARARLQQVDVWANFEPEEGSLQEFTHKRVFDIAVSLEDAIRTRNACRRSYVEDAAEREDFEPESLGRELLFDPCGPAGIYSRPRFSRSEPDSRGTASAKTRHPAVLVEMLEQTSAGCRWLLENWAECRENLARLTIRDCWDNFMMMRLMGKELADAFDDPEAAEVYLASHAIDPRRRNPFAELRRELRVDEMKSRLLRVRASGRLARRPGDAAEGRARLGGIIDRAEARLRAIAAEHRKGAEGGPDLEALGREFDDTPDGERLASAEAECARALASAIRTLRIVLPSRKEQTRKCRATAGKAAESRDGHAIAPDPPAGTTDLKKPHGA